MNSRCPSRCPTRRIVLLAYDYMNLLDLAGPLQALATVNRQGPPGQEPAYEMVVASGAGGLVTTGCCLPIMTVPLSDLEGRPIDTLIAAGGCRGDRYETVPALVDWIKRRGPNVRRLCSVCTGAFMVAATGLLDGRRVATHWDWVERLRILRPDVDVDPDRLFIKDEEIWTSAGVSAGIDLTLALIEEDHGHRTAIETARQLVMFIKRSGGQSQFSVVLAAQSHGVATFADLHAWIAARLGDDLRIEKLAEQVGMSPRTFARAYAAAVGRTPAKTVEMMRLEGARRAIEDTDLPVKIVAASVGLRSEQSLRRVFIRNLGVGPVDYRARFSRHSA